jgi:hypothetical protein
VEALSPDGVPANLDALAFVARKLTLIYKEALDWAIEVRRLYAEECIQPAIDELSDGLDDLINKVRLYGPETLEKIRSYSLNPDGSEIEMRINVGTSLGEKFADLVAECLQNCDSA